MSSSSFSSSRQIKLPCLRACASRRSWEVSGLLLMILGVGVEGGAAPRGGMVGGVGGERLCAGQRCRTMVCRHMEYTCQRLGRGRFWLWWKVRGVETRERACLSIGHIILIPTWISFSTDKNRFLRAVGPLFLATACYFETKSRN